ncbi:DUF3108 domain-containing protein [Anderseniella sp. Alg231-50]|uniref:DUF3108 domain-containing protein n=1 Tax=Anderseniella sp. Alg231-50 TaxID=1922226 RepID=UPI000D561FBA
MNTIAAAAVAATTFTVAFTASPGAASAADTLKVRYDLYTRGVRAFALNYTADINQNSFNASAKLRPKGLASLFIDLKMDMVSSGALTRKGARSDSFTMNVTEKGRKGRYAVSFDGLQPVSTKRKPAVNGDTEAKIQTASAAGARDTLASIMDIAVTPAKNPCDASYRIYNGKEVFKLALQKIKDDTFGKKDGGVYRGPAIVCSMTYSTLAGLSARTEAKYRKNPPVFRVWFAPVRSKALGRDMNVLVAVTGKLKGKDFVAYANRATLSGRPLNSKSLAKR